MKNSLLFFFIMLLYTSLIGSNYFIKCNNNISKLKKMEFRSKTRKSNARKTENNTKFLSRIHSKLFAKLTNKTKTKAKIKKSGIKLNKSQNNMKNKFSTQSRLKNRSREGEMNLSLSKTKNSVYHKNRLLSDLRINSKIGHRFYKSNSKLNFTTNNSKTENKLDKKSGSISSLEKLKNDISSTNQTKEAGPTQTSPLIHSEQKNSDKNSKKSKTALERVLNSKVYWEGWVKYNKSKQLENPEDNNFLFKNKAFFKQAVKFTDILKVDESGTYLNIPNENSFFLQVYEDFIAISSNRKSYFQTKIDTIDINEIKYFNDKASQRVIEVIYNFYGENACFKLHVTTQNLSTWVLCVTDRQKRSELIDVLLDRKLEIVRQKQEFDESANAEEAYLAKVLEESNYEVNMQAEARKNKLGVGINDGYWQLLSDWSQCSKKCGSGESFQQWFCVPPNSNTGKKCFGSAVLSRICNNKPCPGVFESKDAWLGESVENEGNNGNEHYMNVSEFKKPVIRVEPYIGRPQRYEKFVVLEKDVYLLIEDNPSPSKKTLPSSASKRNNSLQKLPSRLVINKNTVSLFQKEDLNSAVFSVNLKNVRLIQHSRDPCCLKFSENTKFICGGFSDSCGSASNPKFYNSMKNYLAEFLKVYDHPEKQMLKPEFEKEQFENVKMDILNSREELIKDKLSKKEENEFVNKEKFLEKNISTVVKREFDLERILEEEEKQKAKQETEVLVQAKKKAQEKKECLEKALKMKKQEAENKFESDMKLQSLQQLKSTAQEEVLQRRENFKQKLLKIRQRARRKYKKLEKEITIIRNAMTDDLMLAQHKGSKDICVKSKKDAALRKEYCDETQNLAPDSNFYCKTEIDFCDYCCTYEFGVIYVEEEADCLKTCNLS